MKHHRQTHAGFAPVLAGLATLALATGLINVPIAIAASSKIPAPVLAKPMQHEREAAAMRLLASDEVQAELSQVRLLFSKSKIAESSDGRSTIDRAINALAYQAAQYAANADSSDPYILWSCNAAHRWMGLDVPSSGYALDNPDNVYRFATLDGAAKYVVKGTYHGVAPSQQTFVIYRTIPGLTQTMNSEGHMDEVAGIKSTDISHDEDGSFTLTIDADPENGHPNHLLVPKDMHSLHLMVRDSMSDWNRELPVELTIERVDATERPAPMRDEQRVELASKILSTYAPYWLNWFENYVHAKPLNKIAQPWRRVQGWGMTQQGQFAFAKDEAWVVTLDPLKADYFNFQISDPWTKAVEYVSRTGSFNGNQAISNPDGTITLVASATDPGVYNWLDTGGLTVGTFQVRWQGLPKNLPADATPVRDATVVKLSELQKILPTTMRMVNAQERTEQLAQRSRSYANRLQ